MYHYSKVIVQINLGNFGSTGTIMRGIADCASREGFKVFCCYPDSPHNKSIQDGDYIICTDRQRKICSRLSRYSGLNGLFGVFPTIRFIKWLREVKPQIIHLHNLHGCGLSLPILFRYIKRKKIRVVWTLHDCWAFTGRCPYFQITKCDKWKTGCHDCSYPKTSYPETKVDGTRLMWKLKKKWFNGIADLTIVTPSSWLANLVQDSFLSSYSICVINNGIDLSVFKPTPSNFREHYDLGGGKIVILGVAYSWSDYKGLDCFIELSRQLGPKFQIVLVGIDNENRSLMPDCILGISHTSNQKELAQIYTAADVFVNPTREEVLGMVNVESLACGTPVITFNTGGCPEIVNSSCGFVTSENTVDNIKYILDSRSWIKIDRRACLKRAEEYCMNDKYKEYVKLYEKISRSRSGI